MNAHAVFSARHTQCAFIDRILLVVLTLLLSLLLSLLRISLSCCLNQSESFVRDIKLL
jgi:hypothetical protein